MMQFATYNCISSHRDSILNLDLNSSKRYANRVLSLSSLSIDFSAFISLSCLGLGFPFSSYVTSLKKCLCFKILSQEIKINSPLELVEKDVRLVNNSVHLEMLLAKAPYRGSTNHRLSRWL